MLRRKYFQKELLTQIRAKRNVDKHPNSAKKIQQQKSAEINAHNARKKEVVVKTFNSTFGQAPELTEEATKAAAKQYIYDKERKKKQ